MASTSETGHAKNIANFDRLISFCTSYGTSFNPIKDSLKLPQLNDLSILAKTHLNDAKKAKAEFDVKTNERKEIFKDLRLLSTRIINALTGVGANDAIIKDARTINRKIQGTRAPKKSTTPTTSSSHSITEKTISTSQLSFDNLIDHFSKLIELLTFEPLYTPNESDLQLDNLRTKLAEMKTVNQETIDTYTAFSNARILRNQTLYNPDNGLVDTAGDVKKYVKSVYGSSSPQFKQLSSLLFKAYKEL